MPAYAIDIETEIEKIAEQARNLRASVDQELRDLLKEDYYGDMMSFVDLADSTTFDKEDGTNTSSMLYGGFNFRTAFSMAFARPSDTATAYIAEAQRRMIVAASRAFCRLNPYWMAAKNARIAYNVGSGHSYSIAARLAGDDVDKELAKKALKELDQFIKLNQYRRRQGEKLTRADRDGEYFLRFVEDNEDGILRVRFIEPIAIQTPPGRGPETDTWFGIQFAGGDYENPIGYYVQPFNYDGAAATDDQIARWNTMIPADQIQHRKYNVDMSSPRGIPTTYCLRSPLSQALSTATSMGRLVDIRARVAMIRKQINGTLGQIQPLLLRNRAGQASNAAGQLRNVFGYPYGTVIDTNDQRTFEFPSQNIETDKIVYSVKTDLQAVSAALGFADFVLSADSGASNFAGALVKEGPMDKSVGVTQQDLIDDDIEVFERALTLAAARNRLPDDVLDQIAINIEAPAAIARNRIQDAQADEIYIRNGALSTQTMCEKGGFDPDVELPRIKADPPPALIAAQGGTDPGNGDTRSHQPGMHTKPTARGVPPGSEPGPGINPQKAEEGFAESSYEPHGQDKPTQEDYAMANALLPPSWHIQVKQEIRGLPHNGTCPRDSGVRAEYEPGVQGVYLGVIDGKKVWAVDASAIMVKYSAPDFVVAGNHGRWIWIPADVLLVDWSYSPPDAAHDVYHEIVETRLMMDGKWAYARAHRLANALEMDFMFELRPELAILKN